MTKFKLKVENFDIILNILFPVFYLFGVVLFNLDFSFSWIKNLSELFLYLTAFAFFTAIYFSYKFQAKFNYSRFLIFALITYFSTLVIEMIGTKTGMIFGEYTYGQVLSLQLFNTPLIIGLNWFILIVSGSEIARSFTNSVVFLKQKKNSLQLFLATTISAILITFFDYIMEPIAVYLDYWNWGFSDIYQVPPQNYLAWFIIAFVFSLVYLSLQIEIKSTFVKNIFWLQLLFFALLRVFMV